MVVDVVQNPQKSNVYEYEKKQARCVGVYSGIMYFEVCMCEVCFTSSSGGFRLYSFFVFKNLTENSRTAVYLSLIHI